MTVEIGDLELFKQEQITLRSYDCIQRISVSTSPDAGYLYLEYEGEYTNGITYAEGATELEADIETNITALTDVTVAGTWSAGFTVQFVNEDGGADHPLLIDDGSDLSKSGAALPVEIEFEGRGYDLAGQYRKGVESDTTIWANVQPLTGNEIEQLENYDHRRRHWKAYTKTAVTINHDIVKDSIEYEVLSVETWYGFYKIMMAEKSPVKSEEQPVGVPR